MTFGLVFWILMLLWFALGFFVKEVGEYGIYVSHFLYFFLFVLLGWKVFGPPLHP